MDGLNLADFLQVVAVYDTNANKLTLQIRDMNGKTFSETACSGELGTGTGNAAGLFASFGASPSVVTFAMGDTGGGASAQMAATGTMAPFSGQIALFLIYDTDAIASGEAGASYKNRINYTLIQ
jgi:hypothetical protein